MVEMDTITGIEPAVGLPKPLVDMLNHLTRDNYLRSWQIYSENIGFTVKIRFGQVDMFTVMPQPAEAVQASNTQQTENTQLAGNTQQIHYARKPPTKLRRDTHRANTYKRKRLTVESSPESARDDDTSMIRNIDTPASVCCDHMEENITIPTVSPLILDFDDHKELMTCETPKDYVLKEKTIDCACCGEPMMDGNHTCEIDTALNSTIESDANISIEIDDQGSCFMSERQANCYSELEGKNVDLYKCYGCGGSCCDWCLKKYDIANKYHCFTCCRKMTYLPLNKSRKPKYLK